MFCIISELYSFSLTCPYSPSPNLLSFTLQRFSCLDPRLFNNLFVPSQLDKTYTGLQTLGAETLVDIWLHEVQREGSDEQGNYDLDAIYILFV